MIKKDMIDVSGLIGKEFLYKTKFGGEVRDTVQSADYSFRIATETIDTSTIPFDGKRQEGLPLGEVVKHQGKLYSLKNSFVSPVIYITSSKGVRYPLSEVYIKY